MIEYVEVNYVLSRRISPLRPKLLFDTVVLFILTMFESQFPTRVGVLLMVIFALVGIVGGFPDWLIFHRFRRQIEKVFFPTRDWFRFLFIEKIYHPENDFDGWDENWVPMIFSWAVNISAKRNFFFPCGAALLDIFSHTSLLYQCFPHRWRC